MTRLILILFAFLFPTTAPHQRLIDVPPISEEYGNPGNTLCDMGTCTFVESNKPDDSGKIPIRRTHLTCADKTRFLMTAEDGTKHCIKLSATIEVTN